MELKSNNLELNLTNLELCFNVAKEQGKRYIGIKVQMPGCPCNETIINEYPNFEEKLNYYKKAYNDNLKLKANGFIKITGFTFGNSFRDIQSDLYNNPTTSFDKLKEVTEDAKNLLIAEYDPHTRIIISQDSASIINTTMHLPFKEGEL